MGSAQRVTYKEAMDAHAREYLTRVLTATGGERQAAAEMAGLNRTHLQALIRRFDIAIPKNPKATARCKCARCSNKTESKGGKYIEGKFVCATCLPNEPAEKPPAEIIVEVETGVADEAAEIEVENGPVRF